MAAVSTAIATANTIAGFFNSAASTVSLYAGKSWAVISNSASYAANAAVQGAQIASTYAVSAYNSASASAVATLGTTWGPVALIAGIAVTVAAIVYLASRFFKCSSKDSTSQTKKVDADQAKKITEAETKVAAAKKTLETAKEALKAAADDKKADAEAAVKAAETTLKDREAELAKLKPADKKAA